MSVPKYRLDAIETIGRKILQEYDPVLLDGPPQAVPIETVVLLSKGAKGSVDLCSARTEVERRLVDSRKVKVDF